MKRIIWIIIVILTGNSVYGQSDSLFDTFNKDFEEFSKSAENEFSEFKAQNDSAFIQFLKASWKEFTLFQQPQPVRPKPEEQPIIKEKPDTTGQRIEIAPIGKDTLTPEKQIADSTLMKSKPVNFESRIVTKAFDVFGVKAEIYYYPDKLPVLNTVNQQSIISFYSGLSDNSLIWNYNINTLERLRQSCYFNDWGYYIILAKASENIFNRKNEQVLFVWYALVKSGYKIKVGYDESNVYLLLPSQQELFNIQFLSDSGLKYYLFNKTENQAGQIRTYKGFYTDDAKIFSFRLNKLPELNGQNIEFRQLMYNQNSINLEFNSGTMQYLNSYPQCDLNIYSEPTITSLNLGDLDKVFVPMFKGKSNREKVDVLLNFIQGSIAYETDQEQFGKERYMFAEECLYYPYSDCEDRAVLLGQLVKHYTGLPSIGLEFKTHVTLAVQFPGEEYGNYVLFEGEKYFICDPTYINAKSGMIPEILKNEEPKVIVF
ncbi:MAG: hypothetical protein JXB49_34090 [Bacteroidales bacterium]|nr:hypothetical protein [Bacteroidales bacterium]